MIAMPHRYRRLLILTACGLTFFALAGPATAQEPAGPGSAVTADQYKDTSHQFSGGGGTDPSSTVGSLPFTGLDLGLMAAAAAGLVAGGFVLRRRATGTG